MSSGSSSAEPEIAKSIGYKSEAKPVSWNQRDLLIYATGIGAKADDLETVYELHKDWKPFPTYPLVLPFKGQSQDVVDFAEFVNKRGGKAPPGMPKFDPNKVVHAEQTIKILKPIPDAVRPEDGWKIIPSIGGVHDKGKGLIVEGVNTLVDGNGTAYCEMVSASYNFGSFNLGGFSKSVSPKLSVQTKKTVPKKNPDFEVVDKTTLEQAVVYRLSGDYNPLHIDPAIGKKLGFGGIILHGLAFYGIAARAIVKHVCKNDSSRLLEMGGRFTSPVLPGQTLNTLIWTQPTSDGSGNIVVDFAQQIKETGKWSLVGCALVKPDKSGNQSKL